MYKALVYAVFIIIFSLITFFGLGPVIFADGSHSERFMTLIIVLAAYILVTAIFLWMLKRAGRRKI